MARDIMLAELTGARLHVAHVSTAGGVSRDPRSARAWGERHRRGHAAPPHADRRGVQQLRHQHQGGAAAARARPTWRPAAPGSSTAPWTRSPRTTRPTPSTRRTRSSPRPHPGCSVSRRRRPSPSTWCAADELSPLEWVRRMSTSPARILRVAGGSLARGRARRRGGDRPGDASGVYDPAKGWSKSRNSPWAGQDLTGRVVGDGAWMGQLVYHVDRGVLVP